MPNVRELENALPVAPLKVLAMESARPSGNVSTIILLNSGKI